MKISKKITEIRNNILQYWNKLSSWQKTIITIVLLILILKCLIPIIPHKILVFIILVALIALLIKKKKPRKKWLRVIIIVLVVLLTVPYLVFFPEPKKAKKFSWSNMMLGEVIPEPSSNVGKILSNNKQGLYVDMSDISTDDFYSYIKACKKKGFTVEADQETSSFDAFNKSGYKLSLYYADDDEVLSIDLDAPVTYGKLKWSTDNLGKLLPTPTSTVGKVEQDDNEHFSANVDKTTVKDVKDYAILCAENGFTVDKVEDDKSYYAKNADGYELNVEYEGNKVMSISLTAPTYKVNVEVEYEENSTNKDKVNIYVDDVIEDDIKYGKTDTYSFDMTKGEHTIKFESGKDYDVVGTTKVNITGKGKYKFKINCDSEKITVEEVSNVVDDSSTKSTDSEETKKVDSKENKTTKKKETKKKNTSKKTKTKKKSKKKKSKDTKESDHMYYSTNDYETAIKGNSGKFAYRTKAGSYYVYWIIDFDEGYAYYFTEGNGDTTCDKLKMDSGTLNDKIIVTYHDGNDSWSEVLHFKYVDHPDTLIMRDSNGAKYKYNATGIEDALKHRDTKTIREY